MTPLLGSQPPIACISVKRLYEQSCSVTLTSTFDTISNSNSLAVAKFGLLFDSLAFVREVLKVRHDTKALRIWRSYRSSVFNTTIVRRLGRPVLPAANTETRSFVVPLSDVDCWELFSIVSLL